MHAILQDVQSNKRAITSRQVRLYSRTSVCLDGSRHGGSNLNDRAGCADKCKCQCGGSKLRAILHDVQYNKRAIGGQVLPYIHSRRS